MQYLMTGYDTTDIASPSLRRNSKVLSFLHDSEDVLEDTGDVVHPNNTDESKHHLVSGNVVNILFPLFVQFSLHLCPPLMVMMS